MKEPTLVKHLFIAPLKDRVLAFPTKIRLVWKGLPRANNVAYCEHWYITAVENYITLEPGDHVIKHFSLSMTLWQLN